MQAVCAKCSRLMCRAVVLFLVAECAQTTPMIAPLPGDPNFSIDGSVAFFKSGESNPTQPNPPALRRCRSPRRQGLCSHLAHKWATSDPPGGRGCVATLPIFGPLLILPPVVTRRGSPRRQGLYSHLAHLWASSYSAPRYEASGIPEAAGVM